MVEENDQSQQQARSDRRWLPSVRGILVAVLLIAGGLFSVFANIGVWSQRAIFDADGFTSRVNATFEDDEVQDSIALRFTEKVSDALEVDERIDNALTRIEETVNQRGSVSADAPEGEGDEAIELDLLVRPLARAFDRLIYESTVAVLNDESFVSLRKLALRSLHEQVSAVIHGNDNALLKEHDGKLVIDLRPLLLEATERAVGDDAEELFERVDFPAEAGLFVVGNEDDYDKLGRAVRFADGTFPVVLAIPVVLFALAVLASRDNRRGLLAVGFAVLIGAILLMMSLRGAESIFINVILEPDNKSAARETMNVLIINDLRTQSLILALGGLLLVAGTWVMGGSQQAQELRARVRTWSRFRTNG